jgi:hypothetical protein
MATKQKRVKHGDWHGYLTSSMRSFDTLLGKVLKARGMSRSEYVCRAVIDALAKENDEGAELRRIWLGLKGKK